MDGRHLAVVADAAILEFGPSFDHAIPISTAEAATILADVKKVMLEQDREVPETFEVMNKYALSISLLADPSSASTKDALRDLRRELEEYSTETGKQLHPFEIAQLMNFAVSDVEEAIGYLPSLRDRFTDADIGEVVQIIKTGRELMM